MNLGDFDTTITEAPMNPNEFAKAIEVGQSEGVLVGYEFEIGIPAAYSGGYRTTKKLASQIKTTLNTKVKIFDVTHQHSKKLDIWYIEPDESLQTQDSKDVALEVVTTPMPPREAVQVLKSFYQLAKSNNFYTGKQYSTGLHINVSIPKTLDVLKLALFLGDEYLLKLFDREDIKYVWSLKKEVEDNLISGDDFVETNTKKKGKKILATQNAIDLEKLKAIANKISDDHYASINFSGKYVSFRHAGGDYLNDYDNVLNVVGRFVRAMIIASDPELYKNEYMKKLSLLVSKTQTPRIKDIDKAKEYLKLLQFIKTNGYPVVVASSLFGVSKQEVFNGIPGELLQALHILYRTNNYKRDTSVKAKKFAKQNILNYYSSMLSADSKLMKMYNDATLLGASLTYMVCPADSLAQTIQILNSMEFPFKGTYYYNNDWAPIYHVEYFPLNHPLVSDSYKKITRDYKEYMDKARQGDYVNEDKQAPIYYFSYGMLTDSDYLPGAELMGVAELRNFEFTMYAYANVEPKTGSKVYGALWKLDKNLLSSLDQIEDYPELYDRRTYPVYMDGKKYPAEVYLMTPRTLEYISNTVPTQQYINTVLKGYKNAGIPISQLYDALDFNTTNKY